MNKQNLFHHSLPKQTNEYEPSPILSKIQYNQLNNIKPNIKLIKDKSIPKRERHILYEPKTFDLSTYPIEQIHHFINNRKNPRQNEMLVNYLLQLAPFCLELDRVLGNSKEDVIRKIALMYQSEFIPKGKIVFKYGDNADRFFLIHQGKVDVFFPYYETNTLTEEEFFIFLLRLKRYEENEMLNNILLLNQGVFLFDDYNFDTWIKKAYFTWINLKIDPDFLNKDNTKVLKKKNDKKKERNITKESNDNSKDKVKSYYDKGIVVIDENELFDTYEKKLLVIALEKELLLTVNKCFKNIICDIIRHPSINGKYIIRKRYLKATPCINNKEDDFSSNLTPQLYVSRFTITKENSNSNIKYQFKSKKVVILKYLHVCTLEKGDNFGDILSDSMTLFTNYQLEKLREASSIAGVQVHQFQTYRLITTITAEDTYVGYINKKWYIEHVRFTSEKINFKKFFFIQNNKLFLNTSVPLLLKSYSICFVEKKLKQGDYLIKENEFLKKDDTKIYFIIKGEFEAKCSKTIIQIDKLLTEMGYESQIEKTLPKQLKELIDTPLYDKLIRKVYLIKLNYILENDIVGLSEVTKDGYYSNSVICSSQEALVYEINSHIIRLLVESDKIIANNKNKILSHKYKVFAESLLKQRKIKLDCHFQMEKTNYQSQRNSFNIEHIHQNSLVKNNNNNLNNSGDKSYVIITQPIQVEKNDKKINLRKVVSEHFETLNKTTLPEYKDYLAIKLPRTHSAIVLGTKRTFCNSREDNCLSANPLNNNKMKQQISRSILTSAFKQKKKEEEDLDIMLIKSTSKFTKDEIRMKKSKVFLERMKEKMKKRMKNKQSALKKRNKKENNVDFPKTKKLLLLSGFMNGFIQQNENKNILLNEQSKLSLNYNPLSKENSGIINPLIVDDFNRTYNTSNYFQKLFNNSYSISNKKNYSNFELNFNVIHNNYLSQRNDKIKHKSLSNKRYVNLNYQVQNFNPFLRYKLGSPRKRQYK